jgi:hypothetical protein
MLLASSMRLKRDKKKTTKISKRTRNTKKVKPMNKTQREISK